MLEVASVVQVALGSRAFFAVSFCGLFSDSFHLDVESQDANWTGAD